MSISQEFVDRARLPDSYFQHLASILWAGLSWGEANFEVSWSGSRKTNSTGVLLCGTVDNEVDVGNFHGDCNVMPALFWDSGSSRDISIGGKGRVED